MRCNSKSVLVRLGSQLAACRCIASNVGHAGLVELREYTLQPSGIREFIQLTTEKAPLRVRLLPLLGMFTCDTGGPLNRVLHFYHYDGMEERDTTRRNAAKDSDWQEYVAQSRQYVAHQESSLYVPASAVLQAAGITPIQDAVRVVRKHGEPRAMYELRQYQLHPGYGTVPKVLCAFEKGFPAKIASDPEGSSLVYVGYTEDLARSGQPPHVLLDCLRYLAQHALSTPALFASPVNKRQLLALKEAYESGRRVLRSSKVVANLDTVTTANLLLLWLGALPEPIFPSEHLPQLIEVFSDAKRTKKDMTTCLRCILKQSEPFILEALFPLFELLHHHWLNQGDRVEVLQELALTFAAPVFGTPAEHGLPPATVDALVTATRLLISDCRPVFTQPYQLQRYQADLIRQETAAEAQKSKLKIKAFHNGEICVADVNEQSPGMVLTEAVVYEGSPLLTPRRLNSLSSFETWDKVQSSAEEGQLDVILENLLQCTVTEVFGKNGTRDEVATAAIAPGLSLSPMSVIDLTGNFETGAMDGSDSGRESLSTSREASSDSDVELPVGEDAPLQACNVAVRC